MGLEAHGNDKIRGGDNHSLSEVLKTYRGTPQRKIHLKLYKRKGDSNIRTTWVVSLWTKLGSQEQRLFWVLSSSALTSTLSPQISISIIFFFSSSQDSFKIAESVFGSRGKLERPETSCSCWKSRILQKCWAVAGRQQSAENGAPSSQAMIACTTPRIARSLLLTSKWSLQKAWVFHHKTGKVIT